MVHLLVAIVYHFGDEDVRTVVIGAVKELIRICNVLDADEQGVIDKTQMFQELTV